MTGLLVILRGCISKGPADERGERGRVFFLGGGGLESAACKFFKISCFGF